MGELRPAGVRRPTLMVSAVVTMLIGSTVAVAPGPACELENDVTTDATDGMKHLEQVRLHHQRVVHPADGRRAGRQRDGGAGLQVREVRGGGRLLVHPAPGRRRQAPSPVHQGSRTAIVSTTAGAVGKTGTSFTLRDLWTGVTSTTSGTMSASAPARGAGVFPSAEAAPSPHLTLPHQ
ncbi:hypothetical protein ABT063_51740 [Streptomyces sp. NPDC002838]|uniref:hypothetical protein n=1 Tax=Streptomyces sp. NPDC002838 TaxID=3154436 RepID=UPI003316F97E